MYPKIRRHLWIFPDLFHKRQINERKYFHSYVYDHKVQLFFPGITVEISTQQLNCMALLNRLFQVNMIIEQV